MKKLIILMLLISILLIGCVTTTKNGRHYGQVTAIEDNGIIWLTTDVYFKTDISSSQEDIYCLDKTANNYVLLKLKLEQLAKDRKKVNIIYHSELVTAPWRCNGDSIIDGVEE